MSILETLIRNPQMISNVAQFASENPQLAKAALSLFSDSDESVGGRSGISGVLDALRGQGLDDVVSSWLGDGDNKAVAPDQVKAALGSDTVAQFASKAGIASSNDASTVLAGLLPGLVDQLSPAGKLPAASGLEGMLSGILGSLGRRG